MSDVRTRTATHRVVNMLFHGIGSPGRPLEDGEEAVWISVDQFEQTLDRLIDRPDVRISFDDGNTSDVEVALPRLVQRGLVATFFPLAGHVGQPRRLSGTALRELQDTGMTIGSHGWRHRSWRHLDPAAAQQELHDAPALLADLCQRPVDLAAIPFGLYGRSTLALLARSGMRRVFSSDGGPTTDDAWCQARNSVTASWRPGDLDAALAPTEPLLTWASRRARRTIKRWR